MQEILRIVNQRLDETEYYIDCPSGQRIKRAADGSLAAFEATVHQGPDSWLIQYIRERIGSGESVSINPPFTEKVRIELEEKAKELNYKWAAHRAAESSPDKCSTFGGCSDCPVGRRLLVREIWKAGNMGPFLENPLT